MFRFCQLQEFLGEFSRRIRRHEFADGASCGFSDFFPVVSLLPGAL
jgi:hypothetical protein